MIARRIVAATVALVWVLTLTGCGRRGGDWPLPNLDLTSTRALGSSGINRSDVRQLRVTWRFRLPVRPGDSGAFTATPVVAAGVAYLQDTKSNVYALDLRTGERRWRRLLAATNPGPNGLAVSDGRVYGATDSSAFALDAATGRFVWRRVLVSPTARFVDIAPQVANGLVYVSTIGVPPNGRGVLYALDAGNGSIRWSRSTVKGAWHVPTEAGGGGAWQAPSVADGDVFWGTANPYPSGGSRKHPNGGAYAGPALYTDSLLAVDSRSGKLVWYDQVTPHDVRDYDFQLPPIVGSAGGVRAVFGAGKAGVVVAWDRATHRRLWQTDIGVHRNDRGALPRRPVSVCPGLLGGVETPMASDGRRLYIPVVDLCMRGSAVGFEPVERVNPLRRGRGELVALDQTTGRKVWTLHLPHPDFGCATLADGVVFTTTFDGKVYGVDSSSGRVLWRTSLRAGSNACPALAGDMLLVGAGVPMGPGSHLELTAYAVGARSAR